MNLNALYCVFTSLVSILLFIHGFFPIEMKNKNYSTNDNIPQEVNNFKLNISLYEVPAVSRVVLMIIDALRSDFIFHPDAANNMPYLNKLINTEDTCIYVAKAATPTVTMPRIKAMTTGSIPGFFDLILNFGGTWTIGDNIIHQMNRIGHKMIFYGDETWLKLFPDTFNRHEGTTSFYVTDFYHVDHNVTRNVNIELKTDDWQFMGLHYLGLDHIGHVYGPKGKDISPKLKEMDDVIRSIHQSMKKWESIDNFPSMLVIAGDHGMRDIGGHGGASPPETLVPLVFVGKHCESSKMNINLMAQANQIDLTPTLSVLLGLPIPSNSVGNILDNVVSTLPLEKKLYSLLYNSEHLINKLKTSIFNFEEKEYYKQYLEALDLHKKWLLLQHDATATHSDTAFAKRASLLYQSSMTQMSHDLIESTNSFDVYVLIISIIMAWQVLIISILLSFANFEIQLIKNKKRILYATIVAVAINFVINKLFDVETVLSFKNELDIGITIFIATLFTINCQSIIMLLQQISLIKIVVNERTALVLTGLFMHMLSMASTSFIEEEHMTYYYFITTFIFYSIYNAVLVLYTKYLRKNSKNLHYDDFMHILKLIFLLLAIRILRQLNSTGDKYQSLPDIADWLMKDINKFALTLVFIMSLFVTYFIAVTDGKHNSKIKHIILISLSFFIYQYKSMSNGLFLAPVHFPITIDQISRCIYSLLILLFILNMYNKENLFKIGNMLHIAMFYTIFLNRPCNSILIPTLVVLTRIMLKEQTKLKQTKTKNISKYVGLYWLSAAFYFFQGNSNSIANIDIASGYTGLSSFNYLMVAGQMILVNMTAPVITFLAILNHKSMDKTRIEELFGTLSVIRTTPSALLLTVILIQRHHLFIWSVFSPKLIYEAVSTILMFSGMLIITLRN